MYLCLEHCQLPDHFRPPGERCPKPLESLIIEARGRKLGSYILLVGRSDRLQVVWNLRCIPLEQGGMGYPRFFQGGVGAAHDRK